MIKAYDAILSSVFNYDMEVLIPQFRGC